MSSWETAACSAVLARGTSWTSRSAPASASAFTARNVPVMAAHWSGVSPSLLARFLSAPASIKAVMSEVLSIIAAACSTLSPLGVRALGDEQLRHLELAFLGGDVKGRLAQLVVRRKVDPGIDQAGELFEITVLDRAKQRLRRSLRMRAGASEGERGDEGARSVFHSSSSRGGPDGLQRLAEPPSSRVSSLPPSSPATSI